MSLRPQAISPVPEQTDRVARAAFPSGNLYMRMRDEFGTIFSDEQFATLFPRRGQPAESPWRLALVTVMHFLENLTDRQAADAVRGRIDWKYALSLELTDPGFNFSVLSEFRARLVKGQAEQVLFETMLQHFQERGLLKTEKRQRTDSTHIVGCIRHLNQLELVGETLRHTLNVLAVVDPAWLKLQVPTEWHDRYGQPMSGYRLPRDEAERQQFAQTVGRDGFYLMEQIHSPATPEWLRQLPAVETLRRVWLQEFYLYQDEIRCRTVDNSPPTGSQICSPYDLDAHYGRKRTARWIGYKVHLTETCEPEMPNLITQVETTVGSVSDVDSLEVIHQDLAVQQRLPAEHIVDGGYVTSDTLADSHHYGVGTARPRPPRSQLAGRRRQGF